MNVLAHSIAQAMADHQNEHRYEGGPNTSPMVEPPEYDADDFEEIAEYVAARLDRGAVKALERVDGMLAAEKTYGPNGRPSVADARAVIREALNNLGGQ